MRKIVNLIIIFLVTTSVSCQSESNFVKVDQSQLKKENIEFAKNLSEKILAAQKKSGYYHLTEDEATKQMIDGLNKKLQQKSYRKIKKLFGDYQNLNLNR